VKEIDEVDLRPMVHLNLGYVAQHERRYDEAAGLFAAALDGCRQVGDRLGMAAAGAALGGVAALKGEFESAVTFFASSEGLRRQVGADPLSASEDREDNARNLAMARAALGEEPFARLWEAGLRMPLEKAVQLAPAWAPPQIFR
jgi:hypothetical protein